jgi:phosphopantothenoylcysteine decarboxylase / phosphopantothenate---cysteine ligase
MSPKVLLGVSGGIAAYKSAELLRRLTESGHSVRVVPTGSALNFVGAATFEALSGQPVHTGVFSDVPSVQHVRLGQEAELVVVAPEPASGRLTGKDTGPGRLPDPVEIADLARLLLERADALPRDLAGRRVVVSAGGTREPLDPVRYLGNRSSGRQGYALATVAAQRGAQVTLVSGTTALQPPAAVELVSVESALELRAAMHEAAKEADAIVMAAAVADFRPVDLAAHKIKKDGSEPPPLHLAVNPDILVELVEAREPGQVVVGFAAETGDESADVLEYGRRKLARKGCDLLLVNGVGAGGAFENVDNQGWLLGADGSESVIPQGSKALLASRIWDAVAARLS